MYIIYNMYIAIYNYITIYNYIFGCWLVVFKGLILIWSHCMQTMT